MRALAALSAVLALAAPASLAQVPGATIYSPPRDTWEHRRPEQVGIDPAAVAAVVQLAVEGELPGPRDMRRFLADSFGREPHHEPIGPVFDRGGCCGLVVKQGYVIAEWGDVARADMCNSVTKTFLSTVVGLACMRGLVHDVHDRVASYMPAGVDLFAAEHNQPITWDHLLRQTSDWQGTLWGKPDWADRPEGKTPTDWPNRPLHEPGTRYKYNDVRVNVLALAALHVWRRPLPVVLREEVMEPIGASSTWRWHGYDDSWIELDGQRVQSVSGGGHWGGGLCISALDLARFGLLFARDGRWGDRQIVSSAWIAMARTPGEHNDGYGFANWFLNTGRKAMPAAPALVVRFLGNGGNIVYVDREHDLVVVTRWIRDDALFVRMITRLLAGLAETTK